MSYEIQQEVYRRLGVPPEHPEERFCEVAVREVEDYMRERDFFAELYEQERAR